MNLEKYISQNSWAKETREKYERILSIFLAEIPDPGGMGAGELRSWLESKSDWGNSQKRVALSAIRGLLRWGFGSNHPGLSISIKYQKPPAQRALNADSLFDLLSSFDTSKIKGRRDLAMAALFVDSGLRVSEIARLELSKLELSSGRFQVLIKGGNWESGVFSEYTASLIGIWLADRERIVSPGVSAVFLSTRRGKGLALTREGIQKIVAQWGRVADIGQLSPHDLRRTFATLSTRRGAPTRVLQAAGRWRSDDMIYRYTQSINQEDFRDYFPIPGVMGLE